MNGMKSPATNHPTSDHSKESLDLIDPGAAGWREVKVEPRPLLWLQPALDRFALVGAVVVQDQVDLLIGGKLLFQMVQKLNEFAAPMARLAGSDHFAVQDVEGGK